MFSIPPRLALAAGTLTLSLGAQAAGYQAHVVDGQGEPLADAVVTLQGPGRGLAQPSAVMDQRDKQYFPRVLAVHTGTAVSFPNHDNIRHQVYSFSPAKRFELRLYEGTPTAPVVFDKAGLAVLGCNIHDWMLGYVYVTDAPWFGVTDRHGNVQFDDLPTGQYSVVLWHPRSANAAPQPQPAVQIADKGVTLDYRLSLAPLAAGTPRTPTPSAFGDAFSKAARETEQ